MKQLTGVYAECPYTAANLVWIAIARVVAFTFLKWTVSVILVGAETHLVMLNRTNNIV